MVPFSETLGPVIYLDRNWISDPGSPPKHENLHQARRQLLAFVILYIHLRLIDKLKNL